MLSGEQVAWEELSRLEPADVCLRAKAAFDKSSGMYTVKSFGQDIFVSLKDKKMSGNSEVAYFLLTELSVYSRLGILWYLIKVQDIPLSGKLKKPSEMSGGLIFQKGAHILPLERITHRFAHDIPGFTRRGEEMGGERLDYADASVRLFPFPRVPVVILQWKSDEEFSARCDLLFDSTCDKHLPPDIIWSTAMMTVLLMLEHTGVETDVRPKS